MLTEKDYCDYDTCVALSELGCPITKWISGDVVSTFTLYEAQKWLREEFKILIVPRYRELMEMWDCIIYDENKINIYATFTFKQHEEALSEGIKEAVKILREK